MARKTESATRPARARKTPAKDAPSKHGKLAIHDNYSAPKRKPKTEPTVTLAEALAEQAAEDGLTVEEVTEQLTAPAEAERPTRPAGTSNLANTIRSYRNGGRYNSGTLTPAGKKAQNNGDAIAQILLLIPLEQLKDLSASWFEGKRYDQLNPGHARMCIGNLIRGAIKKGEGPAHEWFEAAIRAANKTEAESDLDNNEQADWTDTSAE